MTEESQKTGNLAEAMEHARTLMDQNPEQAVLQLSEILEAVPDYSPAMLLKATGLRRLSEPQLALEIIQPLVGQHADWADLQFECALILSGLHRGEEAMTALENVIAAAPDHPEAWRLLADHAAAVGDQEKSEVAYLRHLRCAAQNVELQQAAAAKDANLSALFGDKKNMSFSINRDAENNKITKLYSSKAKQLIERYKFIK